MIFAGNIFKTCSKLHCRKVFMLKVFSYEITATSNSASAARESSGVAPSTQWSSAQDLSYINIHLPRSVYQESPTRSRISPSIQRIPRTNVLRCGVGGLGVWRGGRSGVLSLRFRVQGLGLWAEGSGFGVWGLECRV